MTATSTPPGGSEKAEAARRATFAQRHAVLHDHTSGQEWTPLSFLTPDQAPPAAHPPLHGIGNEAQQRQQLQRDRRAPPLA